jgi:hypothetical protein
MAGMKAYDEYIWRQILCIWSMEYWKIN